MEKVRIGLKNFTCEMCALKVVDALKKDPRIEDAVLDTSREMLYLTAKGSVDKELLDFTKETVDRIEKGIEFIPPATAENKKAAEDEAEKEESEVDGSLRNELIRIIIALVLFIGSFFVEGNIEKVVLVIAYVLCGYEVVLRALRNLLKGDLFDENFLMSLATVGAFAIGEFREAVGVMLFYMIGEFMQDLAVDRSRRDIRNLVNLRPDYAYVVKGEETVQVSPEEVVPGDILQVRQGERIPVDGEVVSGTSSLDVMALTGESLPRDVAEGDSVISGSVNLASTLRIKAVRTYGESSVSKIMELVEESSSHKADTEKYMTRFARIYTPVVVILALMVAFLVPLVLNEPMNLWIRKALIFLVISCPCALVLSIPLGFFGGLGLASRNGILIKGSNYLENLKDLKTVVVDKTGTVTEGSFTVTSVDSVMDQNEFLRIASAVESESPHPIARSIVRHASSLDTNGILKVSREIKGKGIEAVMQDGSTVIAGSRKLMEENSVILPEKEASIYFAKKDTGQTGYTYLGSFVIEDVIKKDSVEAIRKLKEMGIRTVMLSGDSIRTVDRIASEVGVDEHHGELLPENKVEYLRKIQGWQESEKVTEDSGDRSSGSRKKEFTAFVGDGLNDTPSLKLADIGISMGQLGSDAAIEASDVVIAKDSLKKIPQAIRISEYTHRTVMQNIVLSLGIKLLVMIQALFFRENIWLAIFADVGVAIIAVLNSARLIYRKVEE